jgi:hypothetical protein
MANHSESTERSETKTANLKDPRHGSLRQQNDEVLSNLLIQVGIPNTPRQKSLGDLVLEMAECRAKKIAELRAQALKPQAIL